MDSVRGGLEATRFLDPAQNETASPYFRMSPVDDQDRDHPENWFPRAGVSNHTGEAGFGRASQVATSEVES